MSQRRSAGRSHLGKLERLWLCVEGDSGSSPQARCVRSQEEKEEDPALGNARRRPQYKIQAQSPWRGALVNVKKASDTFTLIAKAEYGTKRSIAISINNSVDACFAIRTRSTARPHSLSDPQCLPTRPRGGFASLRRQLFEQLLQSSWGV